MSLADDSGYKVGAHGAHCPSIDDRDLQERVGTASFECFEVDHMTRLPAASTRIEATLPILLALGRDMESTETTQMQGVTPQAE